MSENTEYEYYCPNPTAEWLARKTPDYKNTTWCGWSGDMAEVDFEDGVPMCPCCGRKLWTRQEQVDNARDVEVIRWLQSQRKDVEVGIDEPLNTEEMAAKVDEALTRGAT